MLTRSPIAPHASKASPSLFHYAPHASRSPHHSPRTPLARAQPSAAGRGPTTLKTTSSSSSSSSPAPGRCRHAWVGVDAATQYSPMEPFDYSAPRRPRQQPASTAEHQQPRASTSDSSSTPASTTMTTTADQTMASVPGASAHNTPSRQPPPEPTLEARGEQPRSYEAATTGTQTAASSLRTATKVSPSKRRGSPSGAGRRESEGDRSCSAAAGSSAGSDTAASASNMAKRPKTKAAPPKVLPRAYEHCDVEDMAVLIAHMLGELIETNDALNLRSRPLTRFHSRTAPGISVLDYLHRLTKHVTLTPPLLLSMVYYIDRLCSLYPDFTINTLTVHRFLITAATVAAKGLSDSFWPNSLYARVGGVKVAELKLLELEFLYRVDWRIVPNPEVLVAYYRGLVERCPGYVLQGEEESLQDEDEDDDDRDGGEDEDDVSDGNAIDEDEDSCGEGDASGRRHGRGGGSFGQDDIAGSVEGILAQAAGARADQARRSGQGS